MVKRNGRYFLMNSTGKTTEDTYAVQYAVGDNPLGPFVDGRNTPILITDKTNRINSPGHHAVFRKDGQDYILYHRHSIPFDPKFIARQTCVDELKFTPDGQIKKVIPTHAGPPFVRNRLAGRINLAEGATASASGCRDSFTGAECVLDDNYATRWAAAKDAHGGWLQLDLGKVQKFTSQELRFEYAWKSYRFTVEISADGQIWQRLADYTQTPATGSPVAIAIQGTARFLRLVFPEHTKGSDPSLFEWSVFNSQDE